MKNIFVLIDNKLRKVFAQDFLSPDKLLRRILLYVPQLVFPSQGFVFMNTECMVRQQFHPLNLPEILKMLSQFVQILFRIAQSGHKHVAQPERVPAGLKPFGGMERLLIAPAGNVAVTLRIDFFHIEQNKVCQTQKFLYMTCLLYTSDAADEY